jgi:TonB family protein
MSRISAGMIAAVRGHPIFTLKRSSESYDLKIHVSGVRIHSPTQKIETKPGDTYEIPFEDLPKTLIRRGRRKWIFQYSSPPPVGLFDGLKGLPKVTSESYWIGGLGSLVLGALVSLWMWVQSVSVPEPVVDPIPEKKEVVVQVKPPEPYVSPVRTPPPPPNVVTMKEDSTKNLKKARSDTPGPAPVKKELGGKAVKKENPPVFDLSKLKGALSRFSEKSDSGFVSDKAVRKDIPSDHSQVFDSKAVGHVMDPIDPSWIRPDVEVSKVGGLPGADYTDLRSNAVTGKVGGGDYAQVSPGGGSVEEGLTKEEVDSVVQTHMREVRECHQSAPMAGLLSEGKLEIAFLITPSGRVQDPRVAESSVQNPRLENCVIQKMKSWQFPKPLGNVSVKVSYPFFFRVLGR